MVVKLDSKPCSLVLGIFKKVFETGTATFSGGGKEGEQVILRKHENSWEAHRDTSACQGLCSITLALFDPPQGILRGAKHRPSQQARVMNSASVSTPLVRGEQTPHRSFRASL